MKKKEIVNEEITTPIKKETTKDKKVIKEPKKGKKEIKEKKQTGKLNIFLNIITFTLLLSTILLCSNEIFEQLKVRNEKNLYILEEIKKNYEDMDSNIDNISLNMATNAQINDLKTEIINKINSINVKDLINEKYNKIVESQKGLNTEINNNEILIKSIQEILNEIKENIVEISESNENTENGE